MLMFLGWVIYRPQEGDMDCHITLIRACYIIGTAPGSENTPTLRNHSHFLTQIQLEVDTAAVIHVLVYISTWKHENIKFIPVTWHTGNTQFTIRYILYKYVKLKTTVIPCSAPSLKRNYKSPYLETIYNQAFADNSHKHIQVYFINLLFLVFISI